MIVLLSCCDLVFFMQFPVRGSYPGRHADPEKQPFLPLSLLLKKAYHTLPLPATPEDKHHAEF
jgi:hypothetical protein